MTDKPLRPATREEVSQALGYALQFNRSGKAHRHTSDSMARIAADILAKHLGSSGFVVMKKPLAPLHSDAVHSPHRGIPLKD